MLPILLSAAALPLAYGLSNRAVQQDGIVKYPIRNINAGKTLNGITRRQTTDEDITPQFDGYYYTIDLDFGTPGQTITVIIDTGSSDLWVNADCANADKPEACEQYPRFTESSTLDVTESVANFTYGTGWAYTQLAYDYVSVGPARLSQQLFGIATTSEFWDLGILGVGPSLDGWESPYPYVVDSLAQQGFIESRAFSLDLRAVEDDEGSIVFGGLDTKKYTGPLEKRSIVPASGGPDGYTRFYVYLDGIFLSQDDGSEDTIFSQTDGYVVLLDSGYTVSQVPNEIFDAVVDAFPSVIGIADNGLAVVDCSVADLDATADFVFGKTTISVPFADFIQRYAGQDGQEDACAIGVARNEEIFVLGDSFLRGAYVVYDWDNRNIFLANNEDCGSNLVPISSGPDAVPLLDGECGGARPTTTGSVPTSTSHSRPPYTTTSHGNGTVTHKPTTPPVVTKTNTYTITSCPTTVTDCPVGHVTTETVVETTAVCPETTATYTIPVAHCTNGHGHCKPEDKVTETNTVTVVPITTKTLPVTVPGCEGGCPAPTKPPGQPTGAPAPPGISTVVQPTGAPTGGPPGTNGTAPVAPVPTGGASTMWSAPGVAVLAVGALAAAVM